MQRIVILASLLACSTMTQLVSAEALDAVSETVETKLSYISNTRGYSCKSIEEKVKALIRHLGATNIDVKATCPANVLNNHFRVNTQFTVLASAENTDKHLVSAKWQEIILGKRKPRPIEDDDCELAVRFIDQILPLVPHEVVSGKTRCGASQRSLLGKMIIKTLVPEKLTAPNGLNIQ